MYDDACMIQFELSASIMILLIDGSPLSQDDDDSDDIGDAIADEHESLFDDLEEEDKMADPPKVLSDVLEALVAAVFLDSSMSLATVWNIFKPKLTLGEWALLLGEWVLLLGHMS